MARTTPRIDILERDETTAGASAASTDVVYVPGFADTNANYIIYKKSGEGPDEFTRGSVATDDGGDTLLLPTAANINILQNGADFPCFACNTVDQITWRCVAEISGEAEHYTWESTYLDKEGVAQPIPYVVPAPENVPVLCSSLMEFEAYFGKTPYRFTEDQSVEGMFEANASMPGAKYMYRAGDYEKSYTYAKELVRLGLPVIYENIVSRGETTLTYDASNFVYSRRGRNITLNVTDTATFGGKLGNITDNTTYAVTVNPTSTEGTYVIVSYTDGNGAPVDVNQQIAGAIEVIGTDKPVVGDSAIFDVTKTGENAYTCIFKAYTYAPKIAISINESNLEAYLKKNKPAKADSYTVQFDLIYTAEGWSWAKQDESIVVVDLNDLGIVLDEHYGVATGDTIKSGAIYYGVFYEKALPTVRYLYSKLSECYSNEDKLADKGEYSVKYITSGAYPTYELKEDVVTSMIECAYKRGDAFAIIDHSNNPERSLKTTSTSGSVYAHLNAYLNNDGDTGLPNSDDYTTFATMFTPWATYTCTTAPVGYQTILMPASYGYLTALATSLVTNANWLAIAGINRGLPPTIVSLNTIDRLTNTIADYYQPRDSRALNAITNVKPYGLTIWGNRTLVKNGDGNLTAKSFLNIRSLVCDIKKVAYTAAKSLLFEQNTEILWNKFKALLTPTLDKMTHGYGLSSYKIIKATTRYNGDPLAKGEIAAVIKIYPVYAVEDFEITVVMSDEGVEVD